MTEQSAPNQANALLGEAVLFRARGKPREAIAKCQQALRLLPDSAEAFEILGDLYEGEGLIDAALEAYKRVKELEPAHAKVETKMARLVLKQDKALYQRRIAQALIEGKITRGKKQSPAVAGLLSLLMPGLGQLYNHQWLKATGLLAVYIFFAMQGIATALKGILRHSYNPNADVLFSTIGAFFTAPTLWWTLLLSILIIYSVADAAVVASRSESESSGLI